MGKFDGDWESVVKGSPEGIITVLAPQAGLIMGKHRHTTKDIIGFAIDGRVPHISFIRTLDNCTYVYDGDIIFLRTGGRARGPHYEIYQGTMTKVCPSEEGTQIAAAPDDWTAEKPT